MSLLASETQTKVAAVRSALKQVEDHLGPLLSRGSGEVQRALTSVENAELHVALAFSIASMYFCHLHTQGIDPSSHPIKQELDRIQLYFKKLKGKVEEIREKEEAERQLRIDQDVAKRIVQHYVRAQDAHKQKQRGSDKRSQLTGAEGEQDAPIAEAANAEPVQAEATAEAQTEACPTTEAVEEQNAKTATIVPVTEIAPETVPETVAVEKPSEEASIVPEKDSTATSGPEAVAVDLVEEVPAAEPPKPPPKAAIPKAAPKEAPKAAPKKAPPAEPPSSTMAPPANPPSSSAEKRPAEEPAEGEAPKKKVKKKVLVKVKAKPKAKAKADAS